MEDNCAFEEWKEAREGESRKQEGEWQRGWGGSKLVNHDKDFGLYSKINMKILNVLNEMMIWLGVFLKDDSDWNLRKRLWIRGVERERKKWSWGWGNFESFLCLFVFWWEMIAVWIRVLQEMMQGGWHIGGGKINKSGDGMNGVWVANREVSELLLLYCRST